MKKHLLLLACIYYTPICSSDFLLLVQLTEIMQPDNRELQETESSKKSLSLHRHAQKTKQYNHKIPYNKNTCQNRHNFGLKQPKK